MTRCFNCMEHIEKNNSICPVCGYDGIKTNDEHYFLAQGTLLQNKYIIGNVLGHGGFGVTYIGFNTILGKKVAIKEYLPTDVAMRNENSDEVKSFSGTKLEQFKFGLDRFLDEAKILGKYNEHPCIVSILDYFECNNTAYLVMEYLDGITLNEYLKRSGGKLVWDKALEIIMPIIDALREVHKSGMIHRDISPDNIFITNEGQVKLLDFGAARYAMGEKSKSLSVILKPGYAPPEQYSSNGNQGPWTDIYAISATLYRIITGVNMIDAMDRSMNVEYVELCDMENNTPEELNEVLKQGLEFMPQDRWQKIADFQDKLLQLKNRKNKEDNIRNHKDYSKEKLKQKDHVEEVKNDKCKKILGNKKLITLSALFVTILCVVLLLIKYESDVRINTMVDVLYEEGLYIGEGHYSGEVDLYEDSGENEVNISLIDVSELDELVIPSNEEITRQYAIKLIVIAMNWQVDINWTTEFSDVSSWAEPYVALAIDSSITNGIGENQFGAMNKVSEREFRTWIDRAQNSYDSDAWEENREFDSSKAIDEEKCIEILYEKFIDE